MANCYVLRISWAPWPLVLLLLSAVLSCSPENFAQAQVNEIAFYKAKAGSLFNAMVPGAGYNTFKQSAGAVHDSCTCQVMLTVVITL